MGLCALPVEERPRERLQSVGEEHLSNPELLAILLGSGTKGKSVLQLADEILVHFGGLKALLEASVEELMEIKGVGMAKAVQLKAASAIALRYLKDAGPEHDHIQNAQDAYNLVKTFFYRKKQELLAIILRDVRGNAFHREVVAKGTLTEVMIHPREVFHHAVRHKAHSLIIAHNHPSGDPSPSTSDIRLTNLLHQSSKVMGIDLDDHLIVGANGFVSLRELGILRRDTEY